MTDDERVQITGLRLQHAQLTATVGKKTPPLIDFVPDRPSDKPERPRTFDDWARAILPPASGG